MVKTILFDLDGTLTDPREGIVKSILFALQELGQDQPDATQLERFIGPPLHDAFAELLDTEDQELIEQAIDLYRQRYTTVGLYENSVYPEIIPVLNELKAKDIPLFVATSKPHVYAKTIITHFKLHGYFQHVHGSELDGVRADKVQLIAYILEQEFLSATDTIMVGDRKHDIIGAHKNDVVAVGILWGYGSQEELQQASADGICHKPEQLVDTLLALHP